MQMTRAPKVERKEIGKEVWTNRVIAENLTSLKTARSRKVSIFIRINSNRKVTRHIIKMARSDRLF